MKENRVFPVCSAVTLGPLLDVGPFTAPPKLKTAGGLAWAVVVDPEKLNKDGWLLSLDGSVVLTEGPADPVKLNKGAELVVGSVAAVVAAPGKGVAVFEGVNENDGVFALPDDDVTVFPGVEPVNENKLVELGFAADELAAETALDC